jgi:hypothetical protein
MTPTDEYLPSAASFAESIKTHEVKVAMDNGVYRHLIFRPAAGICSVGKVEIVTFPWSLVITGDMGTWVFSRVEDMFGFFRGGDGRINPYYWSEKVQNGVSGGRRDSGCKEYDPDVFKQNVLDHLDNYDFEDSGTTKEEVLEALHNEIYWDIMSHENIVGQIEDLKVGSGRWCFSEPWEIESEKWCYHYIWCCRFIVWAINQYDALKDGEVKSDE